MFNMDVPPGIIIIDFEQNVTENYPFCNCGKDTLKMVSQPMGYKPKMMASVLTAAGPIRPQMVKQELNMDNLS